MDQDGEEAIFLRDLCVSPIHLQIKRLQFSFHCIDGLRTTVFKQFIIRLDRKLPAQAHLQFVERLAFVDFNVLIVWTRSCVNLVISWNLQDKHPLVDDKPVVKHLNSFVSIGAYSILDISSQVSEISIGCKQALWNKFQAFPRLFTMQVCPEPKLACIAKFHQFRRSSGQPFCGDGTVLPFAPENLWHNLCKGISELHKVIEPARIFAFPCGAFSSTDDGVSQMVDGTFVPIGTYESITSAKVLLTTQSHQNPKGLYRNGRF